VPVVAAAGDLDEQAARELCEEMQRVSRKGGERCVVDFSAVDFVQSAGLGVMFSCLSMLRGHCRIGFAGMDENVGRVLERVGFLEMQGVCFFDDVEGAVSSFSTSPPGSPR
jgi:anti-anti-sigma factor